MSGNQVAGTEENEWSYYDALGRLDARVGIEQGVLDHRYVNLLTQVSVVGGLGQWYRREFMNAAGTDDQPLPGNLTKHWSTYGARGLLAQTHAPMTGTWPLQSDVLHGEIVLNDHLGSPRLRLGSLHQEMPGGDDRDLTLLDSVVAGWAYRNPMDDTPFGRELPLSAEAKTTPEGYTGKPLDLTFGLQAMNFGARFYDPRLGRWWQRDPLAEESSYPSPFAFVVCNPMSFIDPDGRLEFPVNNAVVTSSMDLNRVHPVSGVARPHHGVDLRARTPQNLMALADGSVWYSGNLRGYGTTLIINHGDGYYSLFAHLSDVLVNRGDKIMEGQDVAVSGNTGVSSGPHIHFEIIKMSNMDESASLSALLTDKTATRIDPLMINLGAMSNTPTLELSE